MARIVDYLAQELKREEKRVHKAASKERIKDLLKTLNVSAPAMVVDYLA